MADYPIADRCDTEQLTRFLAQHGQLLLPILELVERAEIALDEVIDGAGRATIEAVLSLSARQLAGEKHPGKAAGEVRWRGRQPGVVNLSDRKLRVSRPRLRRKGAGAGAEVEIPAYEAMRSGGVAARMLQILMLGVSTRRYEKVLPEMAETVGVSKSAARTQRGLKTK